MVTRLLPLLLQLSSRIELFIRYNYTSFNSLLIASMKCVSDLKKDFVVGGGVEYSGYRKFENFALICI